MQKLTSATLLFAVFGLAGCVLRPLPQSWSSGDPTNPNAPYPASAPIPLTLTSGTKRYIDPSIGREASEMKQGGAGMDHSKMPGMKSNDDMKGMDHSKMTQTAPVGAAQTAASTPPGGEMKEMDHSKMTQPAPAVAAQTAAPTPPVGDMKGMDHSKMPGMKQDTGPQQEAEPPVDKAALAGEMKKTSEEMQKMIEALKAKSDALKRKGPDPKSPPDKAGPPLQPGSGPHQH